MLNLTNCYATLNRTSTSVSHKSPTCKHITNIPMEAYIPTDDDWASLDEEVTIIISRMLKRTIFTSSSSDNKNICKHLRQYNSSFAMTSFGAKKVQMHGWNPSIQIHGQIHHRIGRSLPSARSTAQASSNLFH